MNNSERAWIAHLTAIRIEQRARDRRETRDVLLVLLALIVGYAGMWYASGL